MASAKPYRRGVGIVLVNKRGRVFVAERIDTPGAWQMPQGGIDADETPREAALRELREETGTDRALIVGVSRAWLRYDLPEEIRSKVWKGKYRGQAQKWFLMAFTGRDEDIDIASGEAEFSAWKWAAFETLPKKIVGFKRKIYEQVVAIFRDKVRALAEAAPKPAPARRKTRPRRRNRVASP